MASRRKFADRTSVAVEKSKAQIEALVMRLGAQEYATHNAPDLQAIGFRINNLRVRFDLPIVPVKDYKRYKHGNHYRDRTERQAWDAWDQELRRRWRALLLVIKAKIEAIDTGITSFEQEFLPFIVLAGGKTIAETVIPQLEDRTKGNIPLLPGPKS